MARIFFGTRWAIVGVPFRVQFVRIINVPARTRLTGWLTGGYLYTSPRGPTWAVTIVSRRDRGERSRADHRGGAGKTLPILRPSVSHRDGGVFLRPIRKPQFSQLP